MTGVLDQKTDPEGAPVALLVERMIELRGQSVEELEAELRASADRLREVPDYADAARAELARVTHPTRRARLLTEQGILSDEGLIAGVVRRFTGRLAPDPDDDLVRPRVARRAHMALRDLGEADEALEDWVRALLEGVELDEVALAESILLLTARVCGSALDPRLLDRVHDRARWTSAFLDLQRELDRYAIRRFDPDSDVSPEDLDADHASVVDAIAAAAREISTLRELKRTVGTTLRLSSATLRTQQQLTRLRTLVACASSDERPGALARLARELIESRSSHTPALDFAAQKLELLAYLAVGHAAQKGEGYAARDPSDYKKFASKSLKGGAIVAVFACIKLHLSHGGLALIPQGLVYGLNYAVCFVLIYLTGATLATKQPALTASRLSQALEGGPDSEDFAPLVRSISRSQFISFVGNILGAATFALIIASALELLFGFSLINEAEAVYLVEKLHPTRSATILYAAVAGVLLSVAGFIAGAIDNAVVFHRVGERVQAGRGVMRLLPKPLREALSERVDDQLGALSGNVILGFLLGSAGTLGLALGLPIDIRHIAFASSHSALAFVFSADGRTLATLATLALSVAVIGLVNFLVSFSITLGVAIAARRVQGHAWRDRLSSVWRLARARPLAFFLPLDEKQTQG